MQHTASIPNAISWLGCEHIEIIILNLKALLLKEKTIEVAVSNCAC